MTEEPTTEEPTTAEPLSWPDTVELIKPGVLQISVADCHGPLGTGSGFLIDEALVVTNAHVVAGAAHVTVGETALPADVVGYSEEADLALLRLAETVDGGHVFSWVDAHPRVGDDVAALGFPAGAGFTSTRGGVSSLDPSAAFLTETVRYIQTDAAVNPGNSGGPLVTLDGEVAGVVFAKEFVAADGRPLESTGFAVSVEDARRMVDSWAASPQQIALEECVVDEDAPEPVNDDEVVVTVDSPHDLAGAAAQTLALHGNAINVGLYEVAFAVFTPEMRQGAGGLETWQEGLYTSYWRALLIHNVSGSADELAVEVILTTEQAAEYGYEGQTCTMFAIDYTLVQDDAQRVWLIDRAVSRAEPSPCAG